MSAHSQPSPAAARRSSSSLRRTRARNEQNTWPRMVSSYLWKIGRVASSALAVRKMSSTIQRSRYQGGLQRGEPGIGAQHIGAVEQRIEGDAERVDLEAAAGGELEEAAIAAIADEALVAAAQGGFEGSKDGPALGLVLLRLGLVAADDVAAAPRLAIGTEAGAHHILEQKIGGV